MAPAAADLSVARVAALYDIHGNLPALQAVLQEVRAAQVDLVVVGGDVLPGPMPRETLTALTTLDVPTRFIHGNGERVVASRFRGEDISEVPEVFHDVIDWTARQLDASQLDALMNWPLLARVEITGLGSCSSVTRLRATTASCSRARLQSNVSYRCLPEPTRR